MSAYVSLLLATDRLAFRPLTRDDIPSLCARVTLACVADMCGGGHDVRIPSEMERVFARAYLILRHGQIVGTFNFNDDNQSFGIWIAPEHRGCGYASEAVDAFASHPIFGAAIRGAGCFEDNAASRKILERCGFVEQRRVVVQSPFCASPRVAIFFRRRRRRPAASDFKPIGQGADSLDYGPSLVPRPLRALFRKFRADRHAVAE
jgi:GNAT acetyltransferase-like protein